MNHEEHWTQHNHEQLDELQAKLFEVLDRTALLTNQLLAKFDAYAEEMRDDTLYQVEPRPDLKDPTR